MAKTKEMTNEELLALLAERLGAATEETEEGEAATEVDFPESLKELKALDEDALQELATGLAIETDDKDKDDLLGLLTTVYYLTTDKHDKITEEAAEELATATGVAPAKKLAKTIELLAEYLNGDEAEEADTEEEAEEDEDEKDTDADEEEEDEEEDEKPAKKKKKAAADEEDEEAEEEDEAEEEEEEAPKKKSKKAKDADEDEDEEEAEESEDEEEESEDTVDEDTMTERLDQFNEAAEKGEQINVKKLGLKKAYAKLESLLEDDDENAVEWGKPYIKGSSGMCCGLELEEHKVKSDPEGQYGKCRVTGKIFKFDDDEEKFVPYKAKK